MLCCYTGTVSQDSFELTLCKAMGFGAVGRDVQVSCGFGPSLCRQFYLRWCGPQTLKICGVEWVFCTLRVSYFMVSIRKIFNPEPNPELILGMKAVRFGSGPCQFGKVVSSESFWPMPNVSGFRCVFAGLGKGVALVFLGPGGGFCVQGWLCRVMHQSYRRCRALLATQALNGAPRFESLGEKRHQHSEFQTFIPPL